MKWLKYLVFVIVLPYLLWHIYNDFITSKNYNFEQIKKIVTFGEKIIADGYTGRQCHTHETEKNFGTRTCIKNLKMKNIRILEYGNPVIIYRGKVNNGENEMCEMELMLENEGKYAGELICHETWFKTSEADKIPIGSANAYASKLKDAENEKIRQEYLKKHKK